MEDYRKKYGNRTTNLISGIITDRTEVVRWVNTDPKGAGWNEFTYYLDKMNNLCVKNSCDLVVGIIPDGAQVDPKQIEIRQALGVPIDSNVLIEQGVFQNLIQDFAQNKQIPVFDPLQDFREEQKGLYYDSDFTLDT